MKARTRVRGSWKKVGRPRESTLLPVQEIVTGTSYGGRNEVSLIQEGELVTKARGHVSELQSPSRWKAALISVLGEFLSSATKEGVIPFEMEMTHGFICMSIPGVDVFEQTVEVEDNEAEASLLLQNISADLEDVPEEVFRLVFQLAFSTKRALLSRECRGIAMEYFYQMNQEPINISWYWYYGHNVEQCVLQDIHTNDSQDSSNSVLLIQTIYYALGLKTFFQVSPRMRDFAMQIFELIPTESFTQDRWWNLCKAYTEWVLCKDILNKLDDRTKPRGTSNNNMVLSHDPQFMDDVRSLGQRVLPDFQIPEYPSSGTADKYRKWAEEIKAYVMSINLLIISKFTLIDTEDTDSAFMGDWSGMQHWLYDYSGHIYDNVQLQFAKSVHTLVFMHPWNQPNDSPAFQIFHERIWRLSTHNWCWITNVESAKILLEAIEHHKKEGNFREWIWHEQELFNRCMELTGAGSKDLVEDKELTGAGSKDLQVGDRKLTGAGLGSKDLVTSPNEMRIRSLSDSG
ncbi:hypothetical protein K435DRAFT_967655 [Dendrothele bispora CBS 962.96]|uniref:Uncharacterized protein n=1 Tax=Dendrothele bispora (strain CBS 962.96) TaxID=1314807 RepID=A0A4V4HEV5_DENBC|nr:hypothetical protein K435DRAFT_967655 [Dendrothele bispora CBS 962.96]